MATATTKCNVSFQIYYSTSISTTGATALLKYRIRGSAGSYTQHDITSVPVSGGTVSIPDIQASGEYEYILDLSANGVSDTHAGTFTVGKCSSPACAIPDIKRVYLGENDQITMEYSVDNTNLLTPEYQIATDSGFTNIIHFKAGFKYEPIEYIDMTGGNIPDGTLLYMRVRKHCAPSGVSSWSNVVGFRSGKWSVVKAPYTFKDAYCVSGAFEDPTNVAEFKTSICWSARNPFIKTINLTTAKPQVMESYIYLSDGITPAIPENLSVFDTDAGTGGPNIGFRDRGIRWIRFESQNQYQIYEVEPSTGLITGISTRFNCYS